MLTISCEQLTNLEGEGVSIGMAKAKARNWIKLKYFGTVKTQTYKINGVLMSYYLGCKNRYSNLKFNVTISSCISFIYNVTFEGGGGDKPISNID